MSALPTAAKHVLTSPASSPAGPPPAKKSRRTLPLAGASHTPFARAQLNTAAKAAGFPRFLDGDVEIILPTGRRYQMHRAILSMNSQFFRKVLDEGAAGDRSGTGTRGSKRKKADDDGGKRNEEAPIIRYSLRIRGKGQESILVLQDETDRNDGSESESSAPGLTPNPNPQEDQFVVPSGTCFKCGNTLGDVSFGSPDNCPSCQQPHPSDASGFDIYTQNAYENLFLIYYNFTPTYIMRSKAPAEQCYFRLAEVAEKYGSLRAISTRLDHDLISLGDTLWLHVFWDPISWLALSLKIRSAAIFREATIHIIGRGQIITHLARITAIKTPLKVIALMQHKYNEIMRMIHVTERQLRALNYHGDPTPYNHNSGDSTNWLALSLFRSYDSDLSARLNGRDQTSVLTSLERPELSSEYFRIYHQGGDAYLGEDDIHQFLQQSGYFRQLEEAQVSAGVAGMEGLGGGGAASGFRKDVMMLKEFAREIVDPICKNQSKLDSRELEKRGGGYLTCVVWADEELPWWGEEEAW
ncbi:hypothetical protein DFH27DRAFT_159112 [Peziza echinospora]|nr:hypothetical protein DFH27DRAFT_159112 [Peziza echinospora]